MSRSPTQPRSVGEGRECQIDRAAARAAEAAVAAARRAAQGGVKAASPKAAPTATKPKATKPKATKPKPPAARPAHATDAWTDGGGGAAQTESCPTPPASPAPDQKEA